MMRKSQIAIEFMLVLGMAIFIAMVFLAIISSDIKTMNQEKEYYSVRDFGQGLQQEFITASDVKDGYHRKIFLPQKIQGFDYSVSNTESSLFLFSSQSKVEHFFLIPAINGTLEKGYNVITKSGGIVYVN